jgi:hypothetical protein
MNKIGNNFLHHFYQGRYQELLHYGAMYGDYNVPYQRADCTKAKKKSSGSSTTDSDVQGVGAVQQTYLSSVLSLSHTKEGYDLYEDKSVAKIVSVQCSTNRENETTRHRTESDIFVP